MALPMLTRIKAQNLLSFGPEGIDLELPALTVLIGPNGSGKSNLLETVGLLHAAPQDIAAPVRDNGGIGNWIWRGSHEPFPVASFQVALDIPGLGTDLDHWLRFISMGQRFALLSETIRSPALFAPNLNTYILWERMGRTLNRKTTIDEEEHEAEEWEAKTHKSILFEVRDASRFPELSIVTDFYERIGLYRRWEFGSNATVRQPQRIDVKPSPLMEDFSNLGMFLNRFRQHPMPKAELFDRLGDLYSGLRDFELNIEGGTVQIFFTEGEFSIPATRLSDGSLRYLCLLAILLDPEPPSLVCIEEPELGFHPDLIPKLADLLVDASRRCQVIVTTHSDILVDALSDRPESVVVCEKHDGQTSMRRLDRSDLAVWLEKYRLGELWTRGQLGGVRW